MEEDREKSEFNMAVSYLNRINYLFYTVNEAALSLDAHAWFHSLLALFRELSTEMNLTEMADFSKDMRIIQPLVAVVNNNAIKTGRTEISTNLYDLLHNFEMRLRKIVKSSGLQMKMMDDASKSLK